MWFGLGNLYPAGEVHFFLYFRGRGARQNGSFATLNTVVSFSEKL